MIDLEKQYRTKGGYEVKLNFIDGETVYGHFECWKDSWFGGEWNINDGIYSKSGDPECDLVEAKPRLRKLFGSMYTKTAHLFIRQKTLLICTIILVASLA